MEEKSEVSAPKAFVWRRLHSLMGLWLVLYLTEHLLVNSQAALWIGDDGNGFVKLVNLIQSLPYLQVIEIVLLGVPFLIHGIWGVKYLFTSKANAHKSSTKPSLGKYGRNRAYSWQRITSWILLVGIILHVIEMRFINHPAKVEIMNEDQYFVKLTFDGGLYTLADRLDVKLYNASEISHIQSPHIVDFSSAGLSLESLWQGPGEEYIPEKGMEKVERMRKAEEHNYLKTLRNFHVIEDQIVAVTKSPGMAYLLVVRNTFKSPIMITLYTIFVLAAGFHAFNGFWTFLITWGWILSMRSQKKMVNFSLGAMFVVTLLGLVAIWGTYFVNLRN